MKKLRSLVSEIVGLALLFATATISLGADSRLPIPDEATQTRSMNLVRELFKPEFDKARTAIQKSTLAKKLLEQANETDPAKSSTGMSASPRIASRP